MNRNFRNIWPTLLLSATLISIGGVAGFFLRPIILPQISADELDAEPAADSHADHGGNIVELMETSLENMSLKLGKFTRRDYFESIRIPAKVVERVPQGRRHLTAPIGGRIEKVYIAQGQAVQPGDKLFDIEVTDNALSQSQVELLALISEIDSNRQQLERLRPLVEKGVVARKRIIELELQAQSLIQKKDALTQGLGIRGMDDEQINNLIDNQILFKSISIFAPDFESAESTVLSQSISRPPSAGRPLTQASFSTNRRTSDKPQDYFTIDSIDAIQGRNLELGDSLCELTHHNRLLIKGMAFEADVRRISDALDKDWKFSAHFGAGVGDIVRESLPLYQIENHVDDESQTYPVYVELENEIISENNDAEKRRFVNWRFKPGQRAHLEVPIDQWIDCWVVPLEAVVYDGPQAFVFQKINHTHETPDGTVHEFAKTSVKVLHKDGNFAVLAKSPMLKKYEDYALDQAYQLNLVLKAAASGGGGHAHHGHSH